MVGSMLVRRRRTPLRRSKRHRGRRRRAAARRAARPLGRRWRAAARRSVAAHGRAPAPSPGIPPAAARNTCTPPGATEHDCPLVPFRFCLLPPRALPMQFLRKYNAGRHAQLIFTHAWSGAVHSVLSNQADARTDPAVTVATAITSVRSHRGVHCKTWVTAKWLVRGRGARG